MIINPYIGVTRKMDEKVEKITSALRHEIIATKSYVNPRKFLEKYDLKDEVRDSIINKVASGEDIVSASGMLRHLKIDEGLLVRLTGLMDLEQKTVDVSQIFEKNCCVMEKLNIRDSQEICSILEKYCTLTPIAISTRITSSDVKKALENARGIPPGKDPGGEKQSEDELGLIDEKPLSMEDAILNCLTNEYKTIQTIQNEVAKIYSGFVHPSSIVKLMGETEGVVKKVPPRYRRVNIDRDGLIVLLKEAGAKIGFHQTSTSVIYSGLTMLFLNKDIRSADELDQLIEQLLPELRNNISSRIDLSDGLIYDGTTERVIRFTDQSSEANQSKTLKSHNEEDYSEIRKRLISVMSSKNVMAFSAIRSRLITEFTPQEMRDELESMCSEDLVFKRDENTYRLHSSFTQDNLDSLFSKYKDCVISIARIHADSFLELKALDILCPSELKTVIQYCKRGRIINETYNLISFDNKDYVDFIKERYTQDSNKGAFAAKMFNKYGIPNDITYTVLKNYLDVELIGPTSNDKKGLFDLRPSFEGKSLYSSQEFYSKLKNLRPDLEMMRITDYDLSILGFKESDDLVYSASYDSIENCVKALLNE